MKKLRYYEQFIGEAKKAVSVTKAEVKEFLSKQKEILTQYGIKKGLEEELGKPIKIDDVYTTLQDLEDDCIDSVKIRDYSDNSRRWYPYYFHTDAIKKEEAEKIADEREKKSLEENKDRLTDQEKSRKKPTKTADKKTAKEKEKKETEEQAKKPAAKKVTKKAELKKEEKEETKEEK